MMERESTSPWSGSLSHPAILLVFCAVCGPAYLHVVLGRVRQAVDAGFGVMLPLLFKKKKNNYNSFIQ